MVDYIEGTPRHQIHLFDECLDDMIGENNIVRFIDAYNLWIWKNLDLKCQQ